MGFAAVVRPGPFSVFAWILMGVVRLGMKMEIHWRGIRGMRNRIAHGYFEINLDVV